MAIKGIIFDLDGTLLDTLTDISTAMNYALKKHGFPEYPHEEYKCFVGSGVDILVERVLKVHKYSEEDFKKVKKSYLLQYEKTQNDQTKPYSGICELLETLLKMNIKLAILSNKPHQDTLKVVDNYFDVNKFEIVLGQREGVDIKPSPISVFEILKLFQLSKDEILYVGDTNVDMQTAYNAGVKSVGVSWGFRTPQELIESDANFIINKPSELLNLIK